MEVFHLLSEMGAGGGGVNELQMLFLNKDLYLKLTDISCGYKQKNEKNLNQQFRWNGAIWSVQSRSRFPYFKSIP